jgi:osmotically-inducible protein OsmY
MKFASHIPLTLRRPVQAGAMVAAYVLTAGCLVIPAAVYGQTQDSPPTTKAPDNSAQNQAPGATADQQTNRKSDIEITREIRKSVVADSSLSTYAHNVKIITRHGQVTLKGPVKSDDEKQAVTSKAEAVVGSAAKVNDEMTVATASN